jgi:hypothetical protein
MLFDEPLMDTVRGIGPGWPAGASLPESKLGYEPTLPPGCPVPSDESGGAVPDGRTYRPYDLEWRSSFAWLAIVDYLTTESERYLDGHGLNSAVLRGTEMLLSPLATPDNLALIESYVGGGIEGLIDNYWLLGGFLLDVQAVPARSVHDSLRPTYASAARPTVADIAAELHLGVFLLRYGLWAASTRFDLRLGSGGRSVFAAMLDWAEGRGGAIWLGCPDGGAGLTVGSIISLGRKYLTEGDDLRRRLSWCSVKMRSAVPATGMTASDMARRVRQTCQWVGVLAHELAHAVLWQEFGFFTGHGENSGPDVRTYSSTTSSTQGIRPWFSPSNVARLQDGTASPSPSGHWWCNYVAQAVKAGISGGFYLWGGTPLSLTYDHAMAYWQDEDHKNVCARAAAAQAGWLYASQELVEPSGYGPFNAGMTTPFVPGAPSCTCR